MVGTTPEVVIEATQRALREHRLYRCLTCDAITEWKVPTEWLRPGGSLYTLAVDTHGPLDVKKAYSFPTHGTVVNSALKLKFTCRFTLRVLLLVLVLKCDFF